MQQARGHRARWFVLALVGVAAVVWLTTREPSPAAANPSEVERPPLAAEAPPPESAIASAQASANARTSADASADVDADADANDSDDERARELLARWQAALAVLVDGGPPGRPDSAVGESGPKARGDGGPESARCTPGVLHIDPRTGAPTDVVVAVDTSGSMSRRLKAVTTWLAQLDAALSRAHDARLLVVADSRLVRTDAGVVTARVGSNDVLSVLLSPEGSAWIPMLRPGAAVHLVLVTDDDPMEGLVAQFLTQVKALMGEVHVHTVLGFRGNDVALGVDAPLVRDVCAVRAGLEYQQLSVQTGGLRASLCSRAAMSDFPARLIASLPTMSRPCALRLPPEAEVTSVRVGGESLSRVPSEGWDCQQGNRAWTTTSATLTLCPRTCAAVANAGLEVSIRCDK